MTQKSIKVFINETYSKSPKNYFATNKTDVKHIDDIWSLDILDLRGYGPKNIRGYRYVSVIINNFSNFGWTVPSKNKNGLTKQDSFEIFLISSKRKPIIIQSDRCRELYNSIYQNFINNNKNKQYSRNTYLGAVFAECFNPTIRDLLKLPVFERGDANWIDVLPTITKQ